MRGKRAARRARNTPAPEPALIPLTPEQINTSRGAVAWHMALVDVELGHLLGFDYPMNGDARP